MLYFKTTLSTLIDLKLCLVPSTDFKNMGEQLRRIKVLITYFNRVRKVFLRLPPVGLWETVLKSVFCVSVQVSSFGEKKEKKEKTVTLHPRLHKKPLYSTFSSARDSLVRGGSDFKILLLFSVRLYSFPRSRSDAPSPNLLRERKIKYPILIRARHRRARISKRGSLYGCLSLSPCTRFGFLSS